MKHQKMEKMKGIARAMSFTTIDQYVVSRSGDVCLSTTTLSMSVQSSIHTNDSRNRAYVRID